MSKFAENEKVLPILAPADIVATATNTQYVDLNFAAGIVELALNFGAIASTDSTGEVIVTVTVNPVSDTSSSDNVETAMGALAAATATGVAVGQASDNVSLLCFIDPAAVAAAADGARFVRAVITPTAEITSTVVGATARFTPRYAGASIPSST
jgi:hypothetical protein